MRIVDVLDALVFSVPRKKKYELPTQVDAPRQLTADPPTHLTPHVLIRELVACLDQYKRVPYADRFAPLGAKIGDNVRLGENYEDAILAYRKHCEHNFDRSELTQPIEQYAERYLVPIAISFSLDMERKANESSLSEPEIVTAELPLQDALGFQATACFEGITARVMQYFDTSLNCEVLNYDMLYGITSRT